MTEGHVEVPGGRVWYRVAGSDRDGVPLVCLHGGPGFTHDYLSRLAGLADDRPVALFDQLGSGKSDRPGDPALYRLERYVEEVDRVRSAVATGPFHLLGHSWGGALAVAYALTSPEELRSLVLASPLISTDRWLEDAGALRAELPEDVQAMLRTHEDSGFTGCPEYVAATMEFYRRHLCRLQPWPDELERSFAEMGADVYETMWGPTEFHCTGVLRTLDLLPRLGELNVPVLFTCGRHDEARPETVASFSERVEGSQIVVFEGSSHSAPVEETDRFLQVVRDFLARADGR